MYLNALNSKGRGYFGEVKNSKYLNVLNLQGRGYYGGTEAPVAGIRPLFNGISSYANPLIPLSGGDTICFTMVNLSAFANQQMTIIGRDSNLQLIWVDGSSGNLTLSGITSSATIDGNPITSGATPFPQDGLPHDICITVSFATTINSIAGNPLFANVSIYDLFVNDGAVYNFPMDDGWANNPVMRNTGSGADGVYINMTVAAWET